MVAYRNHQGRQGKVLDRQGSHLEGESLCHMDLGRLGRRVGTRLVETVLAGSSAALVAGPAGSVVRPDAE